jgi:protein SCO1/2
VTTRTSHILLVSTAFVAGLVIFLAVIFYATGQLGGGRLPGVAAIGGPFKLIDQDGKPFTDADLKGKPVLVFFGYTHCPDVCPTALLEMSQVLRALGKDADRATGLFITVDPERDTPEIIKAYLAYFDPHLRGATGDQKEITAVEKEYRVYAKKHPLENGDYSMDHSAVVYLMDKTGRFVAPFNLKRPPQAAAAELKKYL